MIAATMKLSENAAELDMPLLSNLYRMCVLELAALVDDEVPRERVRERIGASLN